MWVLQKMFLCKVASHLPEDWAMKDISWHKVVYLPEDDPVYNKLLVRMAGRTGKFNEGVVNYCQYLIKKEEHKIRGYFQELELFHCTSILNMYLIERMSWWFQFKMSHFFLANQNFCNYHCSIQTYFKWNIPTGMFW